MLLIPLLILSAMMDATTAQTMNVWTASIRISYTKQSVSLLVLMVPLGIILGAYYVMRHVMIVLVLESKTALIVKKISSILRRMVLVWKHVRQLILGT